MLSVDLFNCDPMLELAITEIIWEYHQHRLNTERIYKDIHDQLDGTTMGREFIIMNMTSYLYDKYNLIVSEDMGYRIETSYTSDGVEKKSKTVPEIQGLNFSAPGLSDKQVLDKLYEIAKQVRSQK